MTRQARDSFATRKLEAVRRYSREKETILIDVARHFSPTNPSRLRLITYFSWSAKQWIPVLVQALL